MNVKEEPAHEGFEPPVMAMETDGTCEELTANVIAFDTASELGPAFPNFIFGRIDPVPVTVVVVQAPAPAEPSA